MRPLNVQIRLGKLRHNYQILKEMHGGKLLAVVKCRRIRTRCGQDVLSRWQTWQTALPWRQSMKNPAAGERHYPSDCPFGRYLKHQSTKRSNNTRFGLIGRKPMAAGGFADPLLEKPVKVWLKMDLWMHCTGFFLMITLRHMRH